MVWLILGDKLICEMRLLIDQVIRTTRNQLVMVQMMAMLMTIMRVVVMMERRVKVVVVMTVMMRVMVVMVMIMICTSMS